MHANLSRDLHAITIRTFDDLAPHLAAWDQLAWEVPQRSPTLLPAWVDAFLHHRLKPGEKWLCSFAYNGEQLVGVVPVVVAPHPIFGTAWPLLRTPFDSFTPSGDIALAPDFAVPAFRALLSELTRQVPRHLGLNLQAVRQNSPAWSALEEMNGDYRVRTGPSFPYSVIDVCGDFANYMAGCGTLRRNLTRYRKKLESIGPVSVEIRTGRTASESFLSEFYALEASGWKGRNGTAILNDPKVVAFYTRLIGNFAADGRCEWHILRVADRVAAAAMCVRCGSALMIPKIAFDEEFSSGAPGNLLTEESIRSAFQNEELSEIKHMSSAPWHEHWRMSRHLYADVHLIPRSTPASLFQLPLVEAYAAYRDRVVPVIPASWKQTYRKIRGRGGKG